MCIIFMSLFQLILRKTGIGTESELTWRSICVFMAREIGKLLQNISFII